jgi:hypothetical protein
LLINSDVRQISGFDKWSVHYYTSLATTKFYDPTKYLMFHTLMHGKLMCLLNFNRIVLAEESLNTYLECKYICSLGVKEQALILLL